MRFTSPDALVRLEGVALATSSRRGDVGKEVPEVLPEHGLGLGFLSACETPRRVLLVHDLLRQHTVRVCDEAAAQPSENNNKKRQGIMGKQHSIFPGLRSLFFLILSMITIDFI